MDPIAQLLDILGNDDGLDLAALTTHLEGIGEWPDEQAADALTALVTAYQAAREADTPDLATLTSITEHVSTVREDLSRREGEAEEREAQLAELDQQVLGQDDEGEGDGTGDGDDAGDAEGEGTEAPPDEGDAGDGDGGTEGDGDDAGTETEGGEAPARQAARTRPRVENARDDAVTVRPSLGALARHSTAQLSPSRRSQSGALRLVAAGDLPGISAGNRITDLDQLGDAVGKKFEALANRGALKGRVSMAAASWDYPDERMLTGAEDDSTKIAAAERAAREASMESITAAGGLCAPTEVRYDIFGVGDSRRPIRDGFVRFGAARGGIRFNAPPSLPDLGGDAVTIHTEAADRANDGAGTTKPCLTISCGEVTEELVDAVVKCLQVGNFQRRTFGENFARFWELATIQHAREAETNLWDRAIADATAVVAGQVLGAARDILDNLAQAAVGLRSRHRMRADAPIDVVIPEWALDLMQVDVVRQQPGDNVLGVTRAQIAGWLAARNINLIETPDTGQEFGAQAAGALNPWPVDIEVLMYPPGSYLFMDGGELDFGMEIRDSTLNSTNDVQAMMETFEGHAFIGVEALHLTMTVCADGSSSLPIDIDVCSSGS